MSPGGCLGWLVLVQLFLGSVHVVAKVPAVIVFGDSTVDAGNNNYISTIAKSDFQPYGRDFQGGKATGRFSNGRIATDFISEDFGLPPTVPAYLDPAFGIKDFAKGVCFASAGSGYDNATSDVLSVIPLWKELEYFKEYRGRLARFQGKSKASETVREALYVMSLGTNDFLENYYTMRGRRSEYTVEEYQNFLVRIAEHFINQLYILGARKVDLTGLPPMGCLPLERATNLVAGSTCNEEYNRVARDFNGKLQSLIGRLNRYLPGMRVVYGNVYDTLIRLVQKPQAYGFEDAQTGCCATGLFEMGYICNRESMFTCSDANKYVFFDAFHPSEKTNRLIASDVVKSALARFM